MKDKNQMSISIGEEKVFDKMQHLFMIKNQARYEKATYEKPIDNVTMNAGEL